MRVTIVQQSPLLIMLSVIIAVFSTYTSLTMAERIADNNKRKKTWIIYASIIMGLGIFSTHFVGVVARYSSYNIVYNPYLLILMIIFACISSYSMFFLLYCHSLHNRNKYICGFNICLGMTITHYSGLLAIRAPLQIQFFSIPFILSIILAVFFTLVGVQTFTKIRNELTPVRIQNIYSSVVMGITICLMHYAGMKAVKYLPHRHVSITDSINTYTLAIIISIITILIMCFALCLAILDNRKIYAERQLLEKIRLSEIRYRLLVEQSPAPIIVYDGKAIIFINEVCLDLVKVSKKEEIIGKPILDFIHHQDWEKASSYLVKVRAGMNLKPLELRMISSVGDIVEVEGNVIKVVYDNKIAFQIILRDITETKRLQKQMKILAYTDQLTGLPNRHWFHEHLAKVVERAYADQSSVAVLMIDFDNFKTVNDTLGHKAGDEFLKIVANRMKSCLTPKDILVRIGGDEFFIVLENQSKKEVASVAKKLLNVMVKPVHIGTNDLIITLSIGISILSKFTPDGETLIRHSDIAMYEAKKKGKNTYQFFTEDLDCILKRKQQIENGLWKAIERQELQLYYQPQIEIKSGKLVGVEALLRWFPSFGNISPSEFIPIAEESGAIIGIGEWVLKKACKQLKDWEEAGITDIKLAFNVSARQFTDPYFFEKVKNVLSSLQINTCNLEIEITETMMLDIKPAMGIIEQLKKLGVRIAIDDFGAGYSSLNILKRIEIDTLKIDKSIIDDALKSNRNMSILTAIINVGTCLDNTKVIMEGIETSEQIKLLRDFNVIGQGYYYGKPEKVTEIEKKWFGKP